MLTLGAVLMSVLALVFGWAINMDTLIEMNPRGDPLVRQDALGLRIFAWSTVVLFILLQAAGLIGGWRALAARRYGRSFRFSLMAALPSLLVIAMFAYFALRA
jgi:hypothetical protein